MAELSNFNRDLIIAKPKIFTLWPFTEKVANFVASLEISCYNVVLPYQISSGYSGYITFIYILKSY